MICEYCSPNTAGQHAWDCPNNRQKTENIPTPKIDYARGWVCPKCGWVWAWFVDGCRNCNVHHTISAGTANIRFESMVGT